VVVTFGMMPEPVHAASVPTRVMPMWILEDAADPAGHVPDDAYVSNVLVVVVGLKRAITTTVMPNVKPRSAATGSRVTTWSVVPVR
jgi:hypothetical protein